MIIEHPLVKHLDNARLAERDDVLAGQCGPFCD